MKPAGTFDWHSTGIDADGNWINPKFDTATVSIKVWEPVPGSKSKTRLPHTRSLIKVTVNRLQYAKDLERIKTLCNLLNDGGLQPERALRAAKDRGLTAR